MPETTVQQYVDYCQTLYDIAQKKLLLSLQLASDQATYLERHQPAVLLNADHQSFTRLVTACTGVQNAAIELENAYRTLLGAQRLQSA